MTDDYKSAFAPSCPLPLQHETVQLAHGGGGRAMRDLLEKLVLPCFANAHLEARHDASVLDLATPRIAFTTDTFVVSPRFFPGGNIGELAVYGTVNDLACAGATPLYLSCAFLIEEGYAFAELTQVLESMRLAAARCGVAVVTGDTKVVDRGKGDGLYVNTTGIGTVRAGVTLAPARVRPGDVVIASGDIGRHGVAVMSVRPGMTFSTPIVSDCAPIHGLVTALLDAGIEAHCLRDPTRGGLAAALNEIAKDSTFEIEVREADIPVDADVAASCEILGLDPLYVACEGRLVAFVRSADGERALEVLSAARGGEGAKAIGVVNESRSGRVILRTSLGTRRVVDLPSGEQLPRIC